MEEDSMTRTVGEPEVMESAIVVRESSIGSLTAITIFLTAVLLTVLALGVLS